MAGDRSLTVAAQKGARILPGRMTSSWLGVFTSGDSAWGDNASLRLAPGVGLREFDSPQSATISSFFCASESCQRTFSRLVMIDDRSRVCSSKLHASLSEY